MKLTFNHDRSTLFIDQPGCVSQVLHRYGFYDSKCSYTPALANQLLSTNDSPAEGPAGDAERAYMANKPYREAVGDLLWIARVHRYDIQYAVNACSRMSNNPGPKHWAAVCKILRYLNHTRDFKLAYHKSNPTDPVIGYTDSDFAPNYGDYFDNYRSTSGEIIGKSGNPLLWKSRRQPRVALSSAEAEYYAAADASKDLIFVDRIMQSLSDDQTIHAVPILFCDNKSAIQTAHKAQDNEAQRHIDIKAHFIRDTIVRGEINVKFIPGTQNPADAQTKPLGEPTFKIHRALHHLALHTMKG
jgi:hypothetical protein